MNIVEQLTELLTCFPGIGPRQAKRFVYFLLQSDNGYVEELVGKIRQLRDTTKQCTLCFKYFIPRTNGGSKCELCQTPQETTTMLIVEKDVDLENVRKSGAHKGYYFVLGGLLPILEENPDSRIRIGDLRERLTKDTKIKEVILALTTNSLGDNTSDYLRTEISKLGRRIKISTLGRGLSTGAELEYSDHNTLSHALKNRC
ncbi:MAG: hypothetical protein A2749_00010 [Parcubacteria group bacterium RIFCSPHIGHO2_01_FULL_45_26]|nr:MAG: hypothetical protein A2749_00010 [Parcubacteria group bacterium RIFCSPHIGHO2_01_FULL_45_26]